MSIKRILAVETSCDDTSVAIVQANGFVEAMVSASQDKVHAPFGGIVPEIAGRSHSEHLMPLIDQIMTQANLTWQEISALAVTNRPGLVGSLIVGLVTVKTLALTLNKPFIALNHIEGHIWAPFVFETPEEKNEIPSEFLSLVVSGGHTQLVHVKGLGNYNILGRTIDDAAGEAFYKLAKMLGLGYPGGYIVDVKAQQGDPTKYNFPRPMLKSESNDFSFSGLKTAALNEVSHRRNEFNESEINDICASYQEAIVDVLCSKFRNAHQKLGGKMAVSVTGGVSANSRLREAVFNWTQEKAIPCYFPKLKFCTDNAAMIGFAGLQRILQGQTSSQAEGPSPRSYHEDFANEYS